LEKQIWSLLQAAGIADKYRKQMEATKTISAPADILTKKNI